MCEKIIFCTESEPKLILQNLLVLYESFSETIYSHILLEIDTL